MEARLKRVRSWLYEFIGRMVVRYRVRVSLRAKCPACGHIRKHAIRWSPQATAVVHQCALCAAVWMEKPVVAAQGWNVLGLADDKDK